MYTWSYRTPDQCLKALISVTKETAKQLGEKIKVAVTKEVKDPSKVFDLEESICFLEGYEKKGNKLVASRESITKHETHGDKEFKKFYKSVCDLPHVKELHQEEPKFDLLPHHSAILQKNRSVFRTRKISRGQLCHDLKTGENMGWDLYLSSTPQNNATQLKLTP